jgi:glycosyltransferase involved in cell wall biosynthesis
VTQLVTLLLPNLEGGGAERAFVDLANAFAARGIRVDFVLANCQGPYVEELSSTVRVVDFGTTQWLPVLWKLVRYLKRERPDALLSGLDVANAVAIIASLFAGMLSRCVISQRAVVRPAWQIERPRTWRLWMLLFRLTYSRARLVICNSSAAAAECVRDLNVAPGKCVVVLNAVDVPQVTSLAGEKIDDGWFSPLAPPLLLSVGSLTPRKDMGTLIRTLAIVRRTRVCNLLILGEGSERVALEALVRELGLEEYVRLPGFVANPFPWMARADVLLSASLAEGCPNVIQQALALGTAVVATDCPGGTGEVLENGRWGRLVPMRDASAIAEATLATLLEPNHPDGRVRAQSFDSRRTAETYLQLLLPGLPAIATHRDYPLATRPA